MRYTQSNSEYVNDQTITDGVVIDGVGIRLINTESGRISGGLVFARDGSSFTNLAGGIVRLADNDGPSTVVVTGSEGADTVVNGGRITGGISLGGGADMFTWTRNGYVAGSVDLGDGDDVFRADNPNASGTINGGAGYDRYELVGGYATFLTATGFESLHFAGTGVVGGLSGLLAITYAKGARGELERSNSPSAVVTLNGGAFQLGVDGVVGVVNGTADADGLVLSLRSRFDSALLGAGDDSLSTAAATLSRQAGSPVGTVADGGDGIDRIFLGVADGTPDVVERYHVDFSKFKNFEELTFGSAFVQFNGVVSTSDIVIVGATAAQRFTRMQTGGLNRVEIDASNDQAAFGSATITVGDRATLVINGDAGKRATVGSVTTTTAGSFGDDGADDARSVTVINNGEVLGGVQFGIGDDRYDGSAGSVGGTVYGNAGNDTLIGGTDAERFEGGFGADTLIGNGGGDTLLGDTGGDHLDGGAGDDRLTGGAGNDVIDGGAGVDTAVFSGARGDARLVNLGGGRFRVSGADGVDTLTGVERVQFGSGVFTLPTELFSPMTLAVANFGTGGGWSDAARYPRTLADVNGDGRADIVGFGEAGAYVSLGTAAGGFGAVTLAVGNFGTGGGWSDTSRYPRALADVNGDGRADIVGFGEAGAYVSLGTAAGGFGAVTLAVGTFGAGGGWSDAARYPRALADVNGDGRADIVGFGEAGAYVALGTAAGGFGAVTLAAATFGAGAAGGGWSDASRYPRVLADVNGDGRADIVGFGEAGTYVSLGTAAGGFGEMALAVSNFGAGAAGGGWSDATRYPRVLADVNGDGRADIVGFGEAGAYVSLGTAAGGFGAVTLAVAGFGAGAAGGGWSSDELFPRVVADVNGDDMADIVGFGANGTYVALADGQGGFGPATLSARAFGADVDAGDYASANRHPRMLADVNGDGLADLVGFGDAGVYVMPGAELVPVI